jgi:hypothetical protein
LRSSEGLKLSLQNPCAPALHRNKGILPNHADLEFEAIRAGGPMHLHRHHKPRENCRQFLSLVQVCSSGVFPFLGGRGKGVMSQASQFGKSE